MTDKTILCPECLERGLKVKMGKAGAGVSGRKLYQSYRCKQCLRTWLNTKEPYVKKVVQRK